MTLNLVLKPHVYETHREKAVTWINHQLVTFFVVESN